MRCIHFGMQQHGKWLDREDMDLEIALGDIVEGTVTGITKFGAFVELPGNKVGLVHISEVSHDYVKEVRDFLNEQDTVKVKVLKMDGEGKISLSIKKALSPEPKPEPTVSMSFEDMMKKFMQDSNERQVALKRHYEGRKGNR